MRRRRQYKRSRTNDKKRNTGARIGTGTQTEDSFVDLAGYAACAAELAGQEQDR